MLMLVQKQMILGWLMLSRLTCLLALALLLTGCAPVLNLANSAFDVCPSSTDSAHQYFGSPDADDLVVFIHGLCGDAKTTWTNPTTHFVFPGELARDFAKENQPAYVVAFDYVSRLQEGPSILSIADHLEFEIGELLKKHPYRKLRIVAHSMGGLVAREYILRRQLRAHPQLKVTNVVLLATPNNGSELAELGRLISESRQVEELRHIDKGNTYLESLNKDWNREFKGGGHPHHVLLYAGYEELAMPVLGQIVKLSSAISYADDSMGFQQDHVSIAKPKERSVLYRWVKARLEESLEKTAWQLLDGMVKQGLLPAADVPQQLPRTVELLEGLQDLAGTELEKVLTYVKAGQFQAALALLSESEPKESQVIENIARRRFTQGEIHELQFQMAEALSYYQKAVQLAPETPSYFQHYGWALFFTGYVQKAIPQFEEALRLSRASSNPSLEGTALGSLGVAYFTQGQYAKAIEFHEQALVASRRAGDLRGEGNHLGNLGNAYYEIQQYPKAIEFHEQALAIHRKIGYLRGEGTDLGNLGAIYQAQGQYAKAIEFHKQALVASRKAGDLRGEGNHLGNLGNAHHSLGLYTMAIEFHEQALAIHRKIGYLQGEGTDLGNLGSAYYRIQWYAKAIEYFEQALKILPSIGDPKGEGTALAFLGLAYGKFGERAKAIEHLEMARGIFEKRMGISFPWKAELEKLTTGPGN
jgi:tetratricopeptide (TPR) repeat protein